MPTRQKFIILYVKILMVLFVGANFSFAGVIDFENVPGVGTPYEGLQISTQYLATEGVTFSLEDGSSPEIAKVGSPTAAFISSAGSDMTIGDQGIGSYFLTDDGELSGLTSSPLISSVPTLLKIAFLNS